MLAAASLTEVRCWQPTQSGMLTRVPARCRFIPKGYRVHAGAQLE